jgi:predicted RNase H-like HicB family nuclease
MIERVSRRAESGMRNAFNVVIERELAGYYVAAVPALRGCHTQARSLDKLMERIKEATALCPSDALGRPGVTGFRLIRK